MADFSEILLRPGDPDPVCLFNPGAASPFLLIGDHAGIAIPGVLGDMGLESADLARHIACDIGIRGLGEALAKRLDCTFIHQAYSRLVIDCNRDPASPEAIPASSDGTVIPANHGLSANMARQRVAKIHEPYQAAIAAEIARRDEEGRETVLISLHSFTPVIGGMARPWHAGVLHDDGDTRFAEALLALLHCHPGLVIGDNEPYQMDATDHTVPRHAYTQGLAYAELEIRQDLIDDDLGQQCWSSILAEALPRAIGAKAT